MSRAGAIDGVVDGPDGGRRGSTIGPSGRASVGSPRAALPARHVLPVTSVLEAHPLLTPADIRAALARHGLAARKALGQHFITDPNTIRKVVRDAGVVPGDVVVEVGPGLGSLTVALLHTGARVVAVEVDAGLTRALAEVCGAPRPDLQIVVADALRTWWPDLLAGVAPQPGSAVRMVANLPYNIATPLLLEALRSHAFETLHLMVQREVGERWTARPGDAGYGAVSVKIALRAHARIAGTVSRRAFAPVPNVDSVTVALYPRTLVDADGAGIDADAVSRVVDAGFAQRRKQLRNALRAGGWRGDAVDAAVSEIGAASTVRAEELGPAQWAALAAALGRPDAAGGAG